MKQKEQQSYMKSLTKDYNEARKSGAGTISAAFFYAVGIGHFAIDTAKEYLSDPTTDRVTPVLAIANTIS